MNPVHNMSVILGFSNNEDSMFDSSTSFIEDEIYCSTSDESDIIISPDPEQRKKVYCQISICFLNFMKQFNNSLVLLLKLVAQLYKIVLLTELPSL